MTTYTQAGDYHLNRRRAHEMSAQGRSTDDIARRLNVTPRTVQRWLDKPVPEPQPVDDDESWREKAACKGLDTELWFPEKSDSKTGKKAKAVCWRCEPRPECLEWALARKEKGIWGGWTEAERKIILRRRKQAAA